MVNEVLNILLPGRTVALHFLICEDRQLIYRSISHLNRHYPGHRYFQRRDHMRLYYQLHIFC